MAGEDQIARLYAGLKTYKTREASAREWIRDALSRASRPYVACSFGKDSAVMLDMVLKTAPGVPVRFIRWRGETELLNNYDEIIDQWKSLYPSMNLIQVELVRNGMGDFRKGRFDTDPGDYDAYFVGLRADESAGRKTSMRAHGMDYLMASGLRRFCPLAWWSTKDISAYTYSHELPILNSYLTDGMDSRTGSGIAREDYGQRELSLRALKTRDISAYNQLLKNVPDAKYWT